jgi:hypothetical protein
VGRAFAGLSNGAKLLLPFLAKTIRKRPPAAGGFTELNPDYSLQLNKKAYDRV